MAATWQAMKALKELAEKDKRFQPRRTIRGIFWTAEEQGFYGAKSYYQKHKNSSEKFVFVSETDQGAFRPTSSDSYLRFKGNSTHVCITLDTEFIVILACTSPRNRRIVKCQWDSIEYKRSPTTRRRSTVGWWWRSVDELCTVLQGVNYNSF